MYFGFTDPTGQIGLPTIDPNYSALTTSPQPWIQPTNVPRSTNNALGTNSPVSVTQSEPLFCYPNPSSSKESESFFPANQGFCINSRFGVPAFLSGIDEDSRGEFDNLSTDSQGTIHYPTQLPHSAVALKLDNYSHCAVPESVRCIPDSHSNYDLNEVITSSDIRVVCAADGCKYNGPVHVQCLKRWDSSCEFHCRMLINGPIQSTAVGSSLDNKSILEGLFKLYECPKCKQFTLCRTSSLSNFQTHQPLNSTDPYVSVLSTVQFISQQLNMAISTFTTSSTSLTSTTTTTGAATAAAGQIQASVAPSANPLSNIPTNTNVPPNLHMNSKHFFPDIPDSGLLSGNDELGFKIRSNTKHSSWNSDWSDFQTSPSPSGLSNALQNKTLRRFSLRREISSTSAPSTNSSGFFSGYGTSESSIDSSRRNSNNTFGSISNEVAKSDELDPWINSAKDGASIGSRALRGLRLASTPEDVPDSIRLDSGCMDSPLSGDSEFNRPSQFSTSDCGPSNETATDDRRILADLNVRVNQRHNSISSSSSTAPLSNYKSNALWPDGLKSRITQWQCSDSNQKKVVNCKGNIFKQRQDFDIFLKLPAYKQNAYFIQMDDDSCTGNEDTRAFILAQLTNHRVSQVHCLVCQKPLEVYDHFPVVDGIFFISPICHRSGKGYDKGSGLRVTWHTNGITSSSQLNRTGQIHSSSCDQVINKTAQKLLVASKTVAPPPGCLGPRQQLSLGHMMDHQSNSGANGGSSSSRYTHSSRQGRYLHVLCMNCMHLDNQIQDPDRQTSICSGIIKCRSCSKPWMGHTLLVGGLYTYDVFAANPCCSTRLTCNHCHARLDTLPDTDQNSGNNQTVPSNSLIVNPTCPASLTINHYPLSFFSQYSHLIACPYCSKTDYHFVKPFEEVYDIELEPKVN